ncbi:MAG: hypothetical protein K8F25_03310, partial [Fimbriimonadaceae bacterium]|nr:hypothetical protein [Alphaproteobacteria bacterium]
MSVWLHVIGIGEQGFSGLPETSRALIENADIVVGSDRILQTLPVGTSEIHTWTPLLLDMVETIFEWRGRNTVILATGDPTYYGIGNT